MKQMRRTLALLLCAILALVPWMNALCEAGFEEIEAVPGVEAEATSEAVSEPVAPEAAETEAEAELPPVEDALGEAPSDAEEAAPGQDSEGAEAEPSGEAPQEAPDDLEISENTPPPPLKFRCRFPKRRSPWVSARSGTSAHPSRMAAATPFATQATPR